ncbi:MAG: hypothetical protein GF344_10510 [Chitinivibrionales bacterium]|nr:hypothetical protein [Chitinivibrionales bacterium]MBD3357257.1 hypothetical protein [Chitinivibrionales bacterium]
MKIGRWIIGIVVLGFICFLFAGDEGILALLGSHQRVRRMEREVKMLNQTIDSLEIEIVRLRKDTLYIERIAREKLGMARKDETVYKFVGENKKEKRER